MVLIGEPGDYSNTYPPGNPVKKEIGVLVPARHLSSELNYLMSWLSPVFLPRFRLRTPQGVFANEPFTDFNNPENARAMRRALDQVAAHLGREYSLIIGGKRLKTTDKIRSINPARPAQVVGVHQKAGADAR